MIRLMFFRAYLLCQAGSIQMCRFLYLNFNSNCKCNELMICVWKSLLWQFHHHHINFFQWQWLFCWAETVENFEKSIEKWRFFGQQKQSKKGSIPVPIHLMIPKRKLFCFVWICPHMIFLFIFPYFCLNFI